MTTYRIVTYNYGDTGRPGDLDALALYADIIAVQEVADRSPELRAFLRRHPGWALYAGSLPGSNADRLLVNVDKIGPVTVHDHPGVGRRLLGPKGAGPLFSKPKPIIEYVLQDGTRIFNLHAIASITKSKKELGAKEYARRRKHYYDYITALLNVTDALPGDVAVIPVGDLNSDKDFDLNARLVSRGFVGWTTVGTHAGDRFIDHILNETNVLVEGNAAVTVGGTHSDHKPVLRTITIEESDPVPTITQRVARNARRRGLTVVSREAWGSVRGDVYASRRRNKPHSLLPDEPVDTIWQHITVTNPSGSFERDCRQIEAIGYDRFGVGCSYNWMVDMTTGKIGIGQPLDAKGAHTLNDKGVNTPDGEPLSRDQNAVAIAIAVIGMCDDRLHSAAEDAIATLIAAHIEEGAATATFDYLPHSHVAYKECPCDSTRDKMPAIRREAIRQAAQR